MLMWSAHISISANLLINLLALRLAERQGGKKFLTASCDKKGSAGACNALPSPSEPVRDHGELRSSISPTYWSRVTVRGMILERGLF